YVVPTGRVIVPTGRYIVPTGRVIVPVGRYVVPAGSDNHIDNASIHNEAPNNHQQLSIQPQIITIVSNNNAKFPYLYKDEYEVWAIKMEYWITNNDMNIWKRESKARTTLLQSIPDDHIADFHYMDDARDIWNAVKARFGGNVVSRKMKKSMLKQEFLEFRISEAEGLHKGYDRMQKILSQLNQLKAKPDAEEINLRFLRALPSSWSQVALTLKTKGGLEFISFDDLYYKLKTLEVDIKGYITFSSSQSTGPNHSAFVSATSTNKKMSYGDSPTHSSTTTYSIPSNSKTGSYRTDLEQIEILDLEEMDLKWQMVMLFVRVHKFEQKVRRKIDFDKKESARFNKQKTNHDSESDGVIAAKEFGMITGCDSGDAIKEGATKLYNLINGANSKEVNTTKQKWDWALGENELGWDDSGFSVFTTNFEDVEGRPIFHSGTHLIKDCDFYKKQMTNTNVGIGVGPAVRPQPVPTGKPKATPVPTGKPKGTPVPTGNPRVKPVPTGKPKVTPVPTGKLRVKPVPTGKPKVTPVPTGDFYSGCSRSMTGNKEQLDDFHAFHGEKVTFGGGEGRITRKGTIRTPTLDFENVYYMKELQQFNLFSISQICDKKNQVLFTDTECLVLSKDFQLLDDSMVVLKVSRKHNLYTINLNDLCPRGNLACLVAHASFDESVKWHRWMAHVNYKNMNRLVKGNLVRGLPFKLFKNGQTCVACCKGKQHKASYKTINDVSSISEPLQLLHMDLFGPTSIRSIDHKYYCLVIIDDYSRFCWVFFLEHKDETYPIFKNFINLVENQLNKKVKTIRCDNGTEFKNAQMIELYGSKGNKREYSNPRTPQQNGVADRKNKTLIEATKNMLADSKLPTMFWTEAVKLLVIHFKPFGCHVTILNTSDHLGKFDGKADEGYIVRYSASLGHEWYFDLDYLTDSLGYKHVSANQPAGTQGNTTNSAGSQDVDSDSDCDEQVIIVPSYPSHSIQGTQPIDTPGDKVDDSPFPSADKIFQKELARLTSEEHRDTSYANSPALGTKQNAKDLQTPLSAQPVPPGCIPVPTGNVPVPTGSLSVPTGSIPVPAAATMVPSDDVLVHSSSSTDSIFDGEPTTRFPCPSDLGNHNPSPGIFSSSSYDDEFDTALNNVASSVEILKNKRDARGIVVRNKARLVTQGHREEEGIDYDEVFALVARIEAILLFLAFASYMGFLVYRMDVKSVFLYGRIEEEVYVTQPKGFVDPQYPKKVYKVVKALYGLHQAPRAWYATLFTFLLKHGYRRGTIDKTLFLKKNNHDIILGAFQMSAMRELTFLLDLQVQQRPGGIFIHQVKYVHEILNKFYLGNVRTATTPYEAPKPKSKSESDSPVNVHLYRSMIVKKIFKYLKGQPKLGLWYPKESPLMLEAYSNSDYAGANKDRKSTTGGCQFLGRRLISRQYKKQTIVATSSTEAEYVDAANCCA
nr:putative ribonuclease H-like domain-containing protein [Tanacetum cinerariifolium]